MLFTILWLASASLKKQWKPMLFQYFVFPKLQKAMKTNAFTILWRPKASTLQAPILASRLDGRPFSMVGLRFFLMLQLSSWSFWSFKKQWKPMLFYILWLPKASKSNENQCFFNNSDMPNRSHHLLSWLPKAGGASHLPRRGLNAYRLHIAFWGIRQARQVLHLLACARLSLRSSEPGISFNLG